MIDDVRSVALIVEVEMRKQILVLTTTALILGGGVLAAIAQAPDPHHPGPNVEQGSTNPPVPGAPAIQQGNPRAGMIGGGMMGQGVMGPGNMAGDMGHGMMGPGMMGPGMMGQGLEAWGPA